MPIRSPFPTAADRPLVQRPTRTGLCRRNLAGLLGRLLPGLALLGLTLPVFVIAATAATAASTTALSATTTIDAPAITATLPSEERVPGGVALLDVGPRTIAMPTVRYGESPVLVLAAADRWLAVVGLPLSAAVGEQQINVDGRPLTFSIVDKAYPTQPLKVEPKYVNPDPADEARIAREQALMQQAFARFSLPLPSQLRMRAPADGPQSSSFGLRRVFNGEARNPHSGMDIAANKGSVVRAPLPGKVVVTGDFYFNGNTVIVDHGGGLLSLYCHLDRIDATPEQTVDTGTVLGLVGATGRVTGPHLHFSVSLNGARINPALFLPAPTEP
ncbi:peptidoglycan DD-metalloendopeptidase family protein [Permianibacter sp. IMCC34836]|uniref:M23 family metallopeptidase n=1 Tax=Permianibacter fluminis TaxID=2738515 RepID=UPI001556C95B|nr:M23 family metallopeptidase [Permianibacter fluminis]NQD38640.1 peptidoglycan DD-metalloendopeptidase family protein [Permianibacter fluminis]